MSRLHNTLSGVVNNKNTFAGINTHKSLNRISTMPMIITENNFHKMI